MANRSASLDSDRRHQAIIDAGDGCGASPAVFVYTLPNIMLGQVAIKHGLKGESTFFAFPDKSSNFIREYTASLIAEGRMDAVLWGWCEFDGGRSSIFENFMFGSASARYLSRIKASNGSEGCCAMTTCAVS